MQEEWRAVVGHEGLYEVSSQGRVRSLDRIVRPGRKDAYRKRGLVLSPHVAGGWPQITLCHDGAKRGCQVGVVVLEAFVAPCPPGMECCHWDGDPMNNTVGNLRWDTPSNNAADRLRHGMNANAIKAQCLRGHDLFPPNLTKTGGPRGCLACASANKWRIRHGIDLDDPRWTVEADRRYAEIMAGCAPVAYSKRTHCPRGHELREPNLVTKAPVRTCLACRQTHKWAAYHGGITHHTDLRWVAEADARYSAIMSGKPRLKPSHRKDLCKRGHKLEPPNTIQQARGVDCMTCARTRSWAHYHRIPATDPRWLAEADRRYAEIMAAAA